MIAKEKFDFIDICLPCHLHAEYAIKAMRAGFHVLGENPMTQPLSRLIYGNDMVH